MSLYEDVQQFYGRANFGIDLRDLDICRETWTEDGASIHHRGDEVRRIDGRDTILAFLEDLWAREPVGRKHLVTGLWIESADEDEVTVISYVTMTRLVDGAPTIMATGHHRDTLVRDADTRFKFREKHYFVDGAAQVS